MRRLYILLHVSRDRVPHVVQDKNRLQSVPHKIKLHILFFIFLSLRFVSYFIFIFFISVWSIILTCTCIWILAPYDILSFFFLCFVCFCFFFLTIRANVFFCFVSDTVVYRVLLYGRMFVAPKSYLTFPEYQENS